jgi:general secretion pathway protein B
MSLILEALRKSEAERQLGRAPGLMTPMPAARRRLRAPLWAAAAALLAAGLAAGWWVGGQRSPLLAIPPTAEPDPAVVIASPLPVATTATPAASEPTPSAAVAPRSTPTVPRAVRAEPAADPEPLETLDPRLPADPDFVSRERESRPLPPTDLLPTAVPDEAAASPASMPVEALPGLHVLDAGRRARLPPLRMSMHVFAEQVEQRFVLIDGRRYTQGQFIEPDLEIAEIRRDGVVLAVDGRRVLLTRP